MKRSPPLISAILFTVSVAAAVAGGARDKEQATDDRGVLLAIAQAPAKARDWKNPYEGDPDAVLTGKKLYLQHCAECHGKNARGIRNVVNLRTRLHDRRDLVTQIVP